MSAIDFDGTTVTIDRPPNELDSLALTFSSICCSLDIEHVFVSGYVAVLTGRSRATEDIDVFIAQIEEELLQELAEELETAGLWGPAMPLRRIDTAMTDHLWVAQDGELIPHLEVNYATNRYERAALDGAITAEISQQTLPIGPLELQIAYKLWMGSDTDLADALHLYGLFGDTLNHDRLEQWASELEVMKDLEQTLRS